MIKIVYNMNWSIHHIIYRVSNTGIVIQTKFAVVYYYDLWSPVTKVWNSALIVLIKEKRSRVLLSWSTKSGIIGIGGVDSGTKMNITG